MGNNCCINIKQRIENTDKHEIILILQQNTQDESFLDLNDSNPISIKSPPSKNHKNYQFNTNEKNNIIQNSNSQLSTPTGSIQRGIYPQNEDTILAKNIQKSQNQQKVTQHPHKNETQHVTSYLKQNSRNPQNSEKLIEIEKKIQYLENYINELQMSDQMNTIKQPSINEKISNEKEVEERQKAQEQMSMSNIKAIEMQFFEKYDFDPILRVIDQMQQASIKETTVMSIQSTQHQIPIPNSDKVYKIKDSGDIYIGSWNEHKQQREGFGKLLGSNGIYYEGDWVADKFEGRGVYIESDKVCFKGSFKNGQPHGNCIYVKNVRKQKKSLNQKQTNESDEFEQMSKTIFSLKQNCELQGCYESRYKGEFNYGQRHGNGEFIIDKILRYIGGFSQDKFNGYGICVWSQGRIYEGQWQNDKKEGKGSEIWPNGKQYQGEYHNDQFHGYGQLINEYGETYEGYWVNGEMNGQGIITKPDQTSIYGFWQNGQLMQQVPL